MSSLDELRNQINSALNTGISVTTGLKVVKAVDEKTVIQILKSGGVLSAEEVLLSNPDDLKANYVRKITQGHPSFKNVIYATVAPSKQFREELDINKGYGRVNIIMKSSVLNRANTTYTLFDTGSFVEYLVANNQHIEFYKGSLLTESELIRHQENNAQFIELQIRGKVSLSEIEEIVYHDREPNEDERQVANLTGVPLVYKGVVVAGNIPAERAITPTQPIRPPAAVLPTPFVTSPLIAPPHLPDFPDLPKVLLPINPPEALEPSDPVPVGRIPNFTEFKSFDAAEEWLKNGKDLEVNFPPTSFPPALEDAANAGNSGIWHKGIRYSNF